MNTINWDNENEELINEHATSEVSDELTNKVNAILENDDMLMIKNMPLENFDDFIDFNDKANASLSAYQLILDLNICKILLIVSEDLIFQFSDDENQIL